MIDHVVILGGGIAGLAAAAAVADLVARVTIVDRDRFPETAKPRAGVPQARHVHTLLMRGQQELEEVVPGLGARLRAAGAPQLDWGEQRFRLAFGWAPRVTSGFRGTFCSRGLLEHEVRRSVVALESVQLVPATEAIGLLGDAHHVRGVRLRHTGRDHAEAEPGTATSRESAGVNVPGGTEGRAKAATWELTADLVIDASGRTSRLPQWLAELGVQAPPETVVTSNLGYASRTITMPAGLTESWRLMVVRPPLPSSRGGALYPVEGHRWMVTLGGIGADLPPHDEPGFAAFCRSLPGDFGALVEAGEPLTPIWSYRRTANRWRHLDRVRPWPEGLVVMGDALCCFNPVYGQGMSVAAAEAGLLRMLLIARAGGAPQSASRIQRSLIGLLGHPWSLATSEDFRHPDTVGDRSPAMRVAHWYSDRVLAAAVRDPAVFLRFLEVTHLLRPSRDLTTPAMLRRVLGVRGAAA